MKQKISSNNPATQECRQKAQQLQRKLWACAKRNKSRKFHALYDRISRYDVLNEAYRRVKTRQGTYGVDGQTIEEIEARGVEPFIAGIETLLRDGRYKPKPVRRVMIPKAHGGERPLGIPTIRDRVVQMAASIVLTPIFEADFRGCSFGYRPKKTAIDALERIRETSNHGKNYVLDADIKNFFNCIPHETVLSLVGKRISDRRVVKLIRQWLESGAVSEGVYQESTIGTPQGGVISPLLSNIVLHEFDTAWEEQEGSWGTLTRFCDDFVIQCVSHRQAEVVKWKVKNILSRLKLNLHPQKTRIVNAGKGKGSFEFLGNQFKKTPSYRFAGMHFMNRWPSQKSQNKVRENIRNILSRKRFGVKNIRELVPELNRVLQGWGNYFKYGNANRVFEKIDRYVNYRLGLFENRRRSKKWPHSMGGYTYEWYKSLGIHQLTGTVRYPKKSLVMVKANA